MPDEDQYLTPKEVAGILGVHQKTIHLWLRSGKLAGTKISYRTWRIPKSSFEAFIKEKTNYPQKKAPKQKEGTDLQSHLLRQETIIDTTPQSKMKHYIRDIMGEENPDTSSSR